jgi:two-component system, LytTR family, response regulator
MIFCNTVIIENEQKTSNLLRFYLKEYCPEIEILAISKTVDDGICSIEKQKPDIVFLDLDLNDGKGFSVLDKLEEINFEVIITTRNKDMALKAFDYNASHYLLKPFSPLELRKAVNRAVRNIIISDEMSRFVSEALRTVKKECVSIDTGNGEVDIPVQDIIYIEAHGNKCLFIMRSDEIIKSGNFLKSYEKKFSGYNFYRVNRSHFVNLDYVKSYKENQQPELEMVNGDIIHISQSKQKKIIHLMDKFIANV